MIQFNASPIFCIAFGMKWLGTIFITADAEKLINKIESSLAYIRLRLKMAQEQLDSTSQINRKVDFTKERMILSAHFKMRIDDKTYTASEYANLIRLMLNEIEEVKKYGK